MYKTTLNPYCSSLVSYVFHFVASQIMVMQIILCSTICIAQAGIKIAGRNINNLRCTDDTILLAENEEKLKSLLMKVEEESEEAGLKLNIKKN